MPIVNGRYVAPTWINKSVPAINASELNAISGTLAKLDISSIVVGTYDGNGNHGSASPNTIPFPGNPGKLRGIYIYYGPDSTYVAGGFLWIRNSTDATTDSSVWHVSSNSIQGAPVAVTWADDSVSWYSNQDDFRQLNASGKTYRYIAFFGDVNV